MKRFIILICVITLSTLTFADNIAEDLINKLRSGDGVDDTIVWKSFEKYKGNKKIQKQLIEKLQGKTNVADKIRCIRVLGKIGDEYSVKPLLIMLEHKDMYIRTQTAESLGEIGSGSSSTVNGLLEVLKDTEIGVVEASVEALGRIGGSEVITPLLELLRHPNPIIRWKTVTALGDINDKGVIGKLEDMEKTEKNNMVRVAIKETLEKLKKPGEY